MTVSSATSTCGRATRWPGGSASPSSNPPEPDALRFRHGHRRRYAAAADARGVARSPPADARATEQRAVGQPGARRSDHAHPAHRGRDRPDRTGDGSASRLTAPMSARSDDRHVRISELWSRAGLQNESERIPTDTKLRFIELLIDAGLREIEATSLVSANAIPPRADADALV